jgi:hypothetical protein
MIISFSGTSPITITSMTTDSNGGYLVSLVAPNAPGSYNIMAQFGGTSLYGSASSAGQILTVTSYITPQATTLTLNPITSVPWSSNVIVSGKLSATSSAAGIGGKTITFTGTGAAGISSVTTNPDGTFSATGLSPSTVATGWQINANFAGDSTYGSSSTTQSYDTLVHSASLSLAISPSSLATSSTYSVSGTLTDTTTGTPVNAMTISFSADSPIIISSTATDSSGNYLVNGLVAPGRVGSYDIKLQFAGTSLYGSASSAGQTLTVTSYITPQATTLTLNPITSVPWSTNVIVSGQLAATSSAAGIGGKTITFTGTGAAGLSSVTTNPDGTFSATGLSPSTVNSNWQVNANFASDGYYHASYTTQSYKTLKHQISLTQVISPSSVHGILYSISGKLMDASTGTSLSGMIISFSGTSPITITSMTTDSNGGYLVSLIAPSTTGSYSIKAQFVGNAFYKTYSTTRALSVT